MYGIRAHVHFQRTLSIAAPGTWSLGADTSNHQPLRRTRAASACALAAGRRSLAATDPSADRDEPATYSALEEELANEGTGRSAGRPTFGTTEEADRGQGGRHPGGHRRASPRFHHALVHASVGATFGLEQRHGHARLAQGRAATSSTAAVHGQPGC